MNQITVYNTYSKYLSDKFGEKVYKLPISLPLTCPNRDGTIGVGGCIFCGEEGGSFENLPSTLSVEDQLVKNKEYIGKKYNAKNLLLISKVSLILIYPLKTLKKMLKMR